jgi:hypothetical protein
MRIKNVKQDGKTIKDVKQEVETNKDYPCETQRYENEQTTNKDVKQDVKTNEDVKQDVKTAINTGSLVFCAVVSRLRTSFLLRPFIHQRFRKFSRPISKFIITQFIFSFF